MMEYFRNPNCECANYIDINSVDFSKRKDIKEFWMGGYIYKNGGSRECDCHKQFRRIQLYDMAARRFDLPLFEELKEMKYTGDQSVWEKYKKIPTLAEEKKLKDLIVYVYGPFGNQKTTSTAKVIKNLILREKTTEYIEFPELIEKLNNKNEDLSNLIYADWLFIDDFLMNGTINFKSPYISLYNLILKRKKPTVLITEYSKEQLYSESELKQKPFYDTSLLNKLFSRIDKYNSILYFPDNLDKQQILKNGKVDLWS